jgi:integrase
MSPITKSTSARYSIDNASTRKAPAYRKHSSGQASVTLMDGPGGRRKAFLLGKWNSPQSKVEYHKVLAEWELNGRRFTAVDEHADGLTIHELLDRFLDHLEREDEPAATVAEFKYSMTPLARLYGDLPAAEFTPKKLKVVRLKMVQDNLCRSLVNRRTARILRIFAYGVEEELVPAIVHQALTAVKPLKRGKARETAKVRPVSEHVVEETLRYLSPTVAALVQLMRYSGCRPGEAVIMRAADLDVTGPTWLYRPGRHKTEHLGKERVIALGPRCQAILKPFLTVDLQAPLFSPAKAMEERREELRARRQTRVQPSQQNRRAKHRKRPWGTMYTVKSLAKAVARGTELADRAARQDAENVKAREEGRLPVEVPLKTPNDKRLLARWGVNRLRHLYATLAREQYGLEGASAALGHNGLAITTTYAERNLDLARTVAAKIG